VGGVIVRPPTEKDGESAEIHVGQSLTRGQAIGVIAKSGELSVSFQVSETDVNLVHPGQAVSVSGPGFAGVTLTGHVVSVAGEASPAAAGGGPVGAFAAIARLDPLTPAQAAVAHIGMTANVSLDLYHNPAALVVAPAAVQGTAPDTTVTVVSQATGQRRDVAVRLGQSSPDGVEILSGLKPGDVVVWTPPRPAPASGS
jgi:multidrug efflux pump subunit AcrA (membrane-fusion protein)